MTEYGFYTKEELQELNDSDLSFEIADTALLKTPEADEYLNIIKLIEKKNFLIDK